MMDELKSDIIAVNNISVVPKILEVICRTTGMGFAAVARVTGDRWIACTVRDEIEFGLKSGGELKVGTTICYEILQSRKGVVIDNVSQDEIYGHHPTPAMYGFQSYISIPIILADGKFFGTLCAIDPQPHAVNTFHIIEMFNLFSELIAFHLQALDNLALSEFKLMEERKISALREEFIAVLGHDLRNPLCSISILTNLLKKMPIESDALSMLGTIQRSLFRMTELIDNLMDFARGRLGGGIDLKYDMNDQLESVLQHVISELQHVYSFKEIKAEMDLSFPVYCDQTRIAQLFSNLLGNALSYGKENEPIRIKAISNKEIFELRITNLGKPIAPEMIPHLFQPFYRGNENSNKKGLGLGLHIAWQIACSHQGKLDVVSTSNETCFILQMPVRPVISTAITKN